MKTFDIDNNGKMTECVDGEWVKKSDLEKALSVLNAMTWEIQSDHDNPKMKTEIYEWGRRVIREIE